MENLSTPDLFAFQKECVERIQRATAEIKLVSLLLPILQEEIEVRKDDYERDKDLY
tara:strand:- start:806 stop:973 length:168 start_codon:yes stop_codon:yes gene_type:complete